MFLLATACLGLMLNAGCGPNIPERDRNNDAEAENGDAEPIEPVWSQVSSILTSSCALTGCHGPGAMFPSLAGEDAHDSIVKVFSDQVPSLTLVEPGNPDSSYLYLKGIGLHAEACEDAGIPEDQCGTQMPPPTYPQLGQEEVSALRAWISEGASRDG